MEHLGIGKVITLPQKKDAIHVAIAPVIAGMSLAPGEHIAVKKGVAFLKGKHIGIVDPFLTTTIEKGQQFWIFLYPGSITSLRHAWKHPDFTEETTISEKEDDDFAESQQWMEQFAKENNISFGYLIKGLNEGEVCFGDESGAENADSQSEDLWKHYARVTGNEPTLAQKKNTYFRCAC